MRSFAGRIERIGLRGRLMTVGVLGVAGALLIGGVILYLVLTTSLMGSVQAEARSSALQLALLLDSGQVPDPLPTSGAQVMQVIDNRNRVVTASLAGDRLTPLLTPEELREALNGKTVLVPGNRSGIAGNLQVAAVAAGPSNARVSVVAALPTADLDSASSRLRNLLLVIFPLLLLVLALIAWRVIAAALRPVEQMRRRAARIDGSSDHDERLPVPPTRDEVAALAMTLNEMLARVAAARRMQRSFVADAAHELRSPLASIRTQLEVAQRLGEGGQLPAELTGDVTRLTALVEDLLLLARTDAPSQTVSVAPVDIGALLDEVVGKYTGARVPVRHGGTTGAVIDASRDDLFRAMTNLVDNAVRHAASQVIVAIGASRTGGSTDVTVTVTDDGHGIPAPDRQRVFDRFTRLDDARDRDRGGSGLGLAITRELLARNGCSITLEDADPGVRALIGLPISPARKGLGPSTTRPAEWAPWHG